MKIKFDLENSINSGQIFLWEKIDDTWYGIDGKDILSVKNSEKIKKNTKEWSFFRLDDNYDNILGQINRDEIINDAIKNNVGLRITRQDPFQCLISFIISSNSNIQNIKKSLKAICNKFGEKQYVKGHEFSLFPNAEIIANLSESELRECKIGYRASFVRDAAKFVLDNCIDFDKLREEEYTDVQKELLRIKGVGKKVADCVMLFSLEKLQAVPLDTWILRIFRENYPDKFPLDKSLTSKRYELVHGQLVQYFGEFAGYAQQFLFKYHRDEMGKKWL